MRVRKYVAIRAWHVVEIDDACCESVDAFNDAVTEALPANYLEWNDCEVDDEQDHAVSEDGKILGVLTERDGKIVMA